MSVATLITAIIAAAVARVAVEQWMAPAKAFPPRTFRQAALRPDLNYEEKSFDGLFVQLPRSLVVDDATTLTKIQEARTTLTKRAGLRSEPGRRTLYTGYAQPPVSFTITIELVQPGTQPASKMEKLTESEGLKILEDCKREFDRVFASVGWKLLGWRECAFKRIGDCPALLVSYEYDAGLGPVIGNVWMIYRESRMYRMTLNFDSKDAASGEAAAERIRESISFSTESTSR